MDFREGSENRERVIEEGHRNATHILLSARELPQAINTVPLGSDSVASSL
jgi:hypothetical protein